MKILGPINHKQYFRIHYQHWTPCRDNHCLNALWVFVSVVKLVLWTNLSQCSQWYNNQDLASFKQKRRVNKSVFLLVTTNISLEMQTWRNTVFSCMAFWGPSTLRQRNLKTEVSFWKHNKRFPSTLRRRNLKNATITSLVILDLCSSKTRSGKSHNYRDAIVFKKLRFQNVLRLHEN